VCRKLIHHYAYRAKPYLTEQTWADQSWRWAGSEPGLSRGGAAYKRNRVEKYEHFRGRTKHTTEQSRQRNRVDENLIYRRSIVCTFYIPLSANSSTSFLQSYSQKLGFYLWALQNINLYLSQSCLAPTSRVRHNL
jgi:hypothetical protein